MTFAYPVFMDLHNVPVLLVGGGPVASRKGEGLAAAGACLVVVAPEITGALVALAAEIRQRSYESSDIAGHQLVITATSDPAVNAQVAADCRTAGIWVNSADDPSNCSFILPAITRAGEVTIAVSTNGSSPGFAGYLRNRCTALLDELNAAEVAADLAARRAGHHAEGVSTETIDWAPIIDEVVADKKQPADPQLNCDSTSG